MDKFADIRLVFETQEIKLDRQKMKEATLLRLKAESSDYATFGHWAMDGFHCVTVERPWKNNMPLFSCIPEGIYTCTFKESTTNLPRTNMAYLLLNVPDRTNIRIHVANYPTDVEGCIGLGEELIHDSMVTHSWKTIKAFHEFMRGEDFILHILFEK